MTTVELRTSIMEELDQMSVEMLESVSKYVKRLRHHTRSARKVKTDQNKREAAMLFVKNLSVQGGMPKLRQTKISVRRPCYSLRISPCKVECLYLPKNEVSKHLLTRNTTNDASIRWYKYLGWFGTCSAGVSSKCPACICVGLCWRGATCGISLIVCKYHLSGS